MTKKQKYGTTYKKSTCKTNIKRLNCLGIGQISCRKEQPPQFNIEVIQGKACFSLDWTYLYWFKHWIDQPLTKLYQFQNAIELEQFEYQVTICCGQLQQSLGQSEYYLAFIFSLS